MVKMIRLDDLRLIKININSFLMNTDIDWEKKFSSTISTALILINLLQFPLRRDKTKNRNMAEGDIVIVCL